MKGNLPAVCVDCGEHIMYSKKPAQTHADYLKRQRCPECGNFALKTESLEL